MTTRTRPLHDGFLRSCERRPDRPALEIQGKVLTFQDLGTLATTLAATLQKHGPSRGPRLTAVFGARSVTAFGGVLGALLSGHGYVPLNPSFPASRTRTMLLQSRCRTVIVDEAASAQLHDVLTGIAVPLLVVLPTQDDVKPFAARWLQHRFVGARQLVDAGEWQSPDVSADDLAYLLFTSGSTGLPKGVGVAHRNARALVDTLAGRYRITEHDRFSQTFDFTFDLSVFDLFVAWDRGACVCCPSAKTLLSPGQFIQRSRLTVWFSVPSIGINMKRMRLLTPGGFPGLRWSLFCGEPLPGDVAQAWASAAPASTVENLYGPTELTVACTAYRWTSSDVSAPSHAWVPIGYPFPRMKSLIVDERLEGVPPGAAGELLMTGPQLTPGYWNDPDRTAQAFVVPPGQDETYYRTGDIVRQPVGGGPLVYLGRRDSQVKVNGYRVELGEVEAALRAAGEVEAAVAVPWPLTPSGAGGVVGFLQGSSVAPETIRGRLKLALPSYMVPRDLHIVSVFPLNPNGKVDRQQLSRMLEVPIERRAG